MKHFTLGFAALLFLACSTTKKISGEKDYQALANELAQKFIILDGHVDLPYRLKVNNFRLEKEFIGIPIASQEGDFLTMNELRKVAWMHPLCLFTFPPVIKKMAKQNPWQIH